MLSETLYGWYSLNAYNNNEPEYTYINISGQKTLCTITSYEKICPYSSDNFLYKDAVFVGELNYQC